MTGFTLGDLLRGHAAERPGAPAVTLTDPTWGDRTVTFGELHARSSQTARAMAARGVGRGDRVALLDKNAPTFHDVVFGAAKLGAVTIGLNFRLAAPELAAIVADAAPALVIASPELRHLLPADLDVLELGAPFEAALAAESFDDVDIVVTDDEIALQLYSSGTTGRPKGTMISHANLAWTVRMGREFYGMDTTTVNLVPSPLFHIGGAGYGLTALGQGGHTVLVRDVEPGLLLDLVERHRVTHTFLVPAVVQMLADHPSLPERDLDSLSRVAYGAAPMGETQLLRAIDAFGCEFMGVYGMTETSGTVVTLDPADHDPVGPRSRLLRSVGKPLPWLTIRIADPLTGDEVATGLVGEIWVHSGQNMVGYWHQPQLTADTLVDDGWLRTGDAGYLDAEGYLFLHDRLKDMIVTGGENVYPAEVENVLGAHPEVQDLAVIGVPSERWGETVKAMVVRRPGSSVEAAELSTFVRERLAHYKCPTSFDFVDTLPRNASGKVLKYQLRAPFWADLDRAVH